MAVMTQPSTIHVWMGYQYWPPIHTCCKVRWLTLRLTIQNPLQQNNRRCSDMSVEHYGMFIICCITGESSVVNIGNVWDGWFTCYMTIKWRSIRFSNANCIFNEIIVLRSTSSKKMIQVNSIFFHNDWRENE